MDLLAEGARSLRIVTILAVAIAAHLCVLGLRALGRRVMVSRMAGASSKVRTVTSLLVSVAMFVLYFVTLGLVLKEFGVSLTAYFASASIIGLAVGFGSQGLVQDVVTGLTVIFSNLFNVGDMVEVGGQTGIVQSLGIRFTVLTNFMGAQVFIPNRTISNVIRYPRGYVRALLDVNLPDEEDKARMAEERITLLVQSAHEQFPGILITPPTIQGRKQTSSGKQFLRVKFRVWPGQGGPLEQRVRPELVQGLKSLDPAYADWMVGVSYEVEEKALSIPLHRTRRKP